jgi:two-component sensor histidine kinase
MNTVLLSHQLELSTQPRDDLIFSAESNHRIGNNLALIAAMIRLQANDLAKRDGLMPVADAKRLLAETAARVESVGRLHRRLATVSADAVIDVGEYVEEIARATIASLDPTGMSTAMFDLRRSGGLHARHVLPLGLIVGEVVSNALKYAHPTGLATALTVRCERHGKSLFVEIVDDGVGLPEQFDLETAAGLGLRLVRSLCEQLSATPRFESLPLGMRFTLSVPIQSE